MSFFDLRIYYLDESNMCFDDSHVVHMRLLVMLLSLDPLEIFLGQNPLFIIFCIEGEIIRLTLSLISKNVTIFHYL